MSIQPASHGSELRWGKSGFGDRRFSDGLVSPVQRNAAALLSVGPLNQGVEFLPFPKHPSDGYCSTVQRVSRTGDMHPDRLGVTWCIIRPGSRTGRDSFPSHGSSDDGLWS